MDNTPLVTIFIPTFKRPHSLKKAIRSALSQTFRDLQVIVCDNASNDETAQIVAALAKKDSRLKYVCHPTNIGMLGNYQFGLSNVKSKYFSFLSDDDLLLPNFCQTALEGFSVYPEISFFACSTVSLSVQHGIICIPLDIWPRSGWFSSTEGLPEIIGKYPVPTTVLFRKDAAIKAHIDFENPIAWDCDFLVQLASQFPFAISKERCGLFIDHENSYSGSKDCRLTLDSIRHMMARVKNFAWIDEKTKESVVSRLHNFLHDVAFGSIFSNLSKGEFKKARQICQYLLKCRPLKLKTILCLIKSLLPTWAVRRSSKPKQFDPKWKGFAKYKKLIKAL